MAGLQLATAVGQIDSLSYGEVTIYNSTSIAAPPGLLSLGMGLARTSELPVLTLEFADARSPVLNFNLSGLEWVTAPTHWDSLQVGVPIGATDGKVTFAGWDSAQISSRAFVGPAPLEFNFTEESAYTFALQLNWGSLAVAAHGVAPGQFGEIELLPQFRVFDVTLAEQTKWGGAIVAALPILEFDFTEVTGPGTAFRFGDDRYVAAFRSAVEGYVGSPSIDLNLNYITPLELDATQFGLQLGRLDTGVVNFELSSYWETSTSAIQFTFGDALEVRFTGIDSFESGNCFASQSERWLSFYGSRNTQWGDTLVEYDGIPRALPAWTGRTLFGEAQIYNASQVVEFFSVETLPPPQTQWGIPHEWYDVGYAEIPDDADTDVEFFGFQVYIRWPVYISVAPDTLEGWPPYTQWGDTLVAYHTRWVDLHEPHPGAFVGEPVIGNSPRYVDPFWFVAFESGEITVGRHTEFEAPFISDGAVGQPDVQWGNVIFAGDIESTDLVAGASWISHSPRYLDHKQRENFLTVSEDLQVFNSLQFVTFALTPETQHNAEYGNYTLVDNRNKTLGVMGIPSLRMPVQFEGVWLAGDALEVVGLNATEWGADTFIAPAIREYTPLSWDNLYVTRYTNTVANAAMNFTPESLVNEQLFGQAKVWDIRQWAGVWQFDALEVGLPFIAYGVRTLTQYPHWFPLTKMGTPYIGNWEQHLDMEGVVPPVLGEFIVAGPFLRGFKPSWPNTALERFGDTTRIWNFNPQAWPPGFRRDIFGERSWISHAPRSLELTGMGEPFFPRPIVAFRDREFEAFGAPMLEVSEAFQVRNLAPDPPRAIVVRDVGDICLGKSTNNSNECAVFGEASIQANNIIFNIDTGSLNFLEFGITWIRAQGCILRNYKQSLAMGTPTLGGPHYITVEPFDVKPEGPFWQEIQEPQATEWGQTVCSPQTIWCQNPAPVQARKNHLDGDEFNWPTCTEHNIECSPFFGRPAVTLKHRTVKVTHLKSNAIGNFETNPTVALGTHYVNLEGFSTYTPSVSSLTPRTLRAFLISCESEIGPDGITVTNAQATEPGAQYLTPTETDFTEFGSIRLSPVTLYAEGTEHTLWGDNHPMVHFPLRLYVQSLDATQFGDNWPSHAIRSITVTGIDILPTYNLGPMDTFMRVSGGPLPIDYVYRLVAFTGFDSFETGELICPITDTPVSPYMIGPPCIPPHFAAITHG